VADAVSVNVAKMLHEALGKVLHAFDERT